MDTNESYDLSFPPLPTPPQTPTVLPLPTQNDERDGIATISLDEKSNSEESDVDAYDMALDDVHTRFILNLPPNELASADRIFFQLEQAYWFYDDFYCDGHDENSSEEPLPRFKNLRHFCQTMFQVSPILSPNLPKFKEMWEEFSAYKRSISTYGTILLNEDCTKVVLCQDWNGKSWTFPAGKINQHETGIETGVRETYEETGFDINCQMGLTREMDVSWKKLNAKDALMYVEDGTKKQRTCYVCRGVPEDFPFEPVARKEVSDVQWFDLNELPKKTFAVLPFIGQLKKWIRKKGFGSGSRGRGTKSGNNSGSAKGTPPRSQSTGKQKSNNSRKRAKRNKSRNNSRGKVREGDSVTKSGLAGIGDTDGWTEEDMFRANERILGHEITYDGNPHTFADAMANSNPHKFHVVGGSFMNSRNENNEVGGTILAPPPEKSALQPLYSRDGSDGDEKDFEPFFSDGGKTPWGEVVDGLETNESPDQNTMAFGSNEKGLELLNKLKKDTPKETLKNITPPENHLQEESFMTDIEITARSRQKKLKSNKRHKSINDNSDDWMYVQNWVKSLERPPPSKHFGEFKFDADSIMDAVNRILQI